MEVTQARVIQRRSSLKKTVANQGEEDKSNTRKIVTWASPLAKRSCIQWKGLFADLFHGTRFEVDQGPWTRVITRKEKKQQRIFYSTRKLKTHQGSTSTKRQQKNTDDHHFSKLKRSCYRCGDHDHLVMDCRNGIRCSRCHGIGHRAARCRAILPGDRLRNMERGRSVDSRRRSISSHRSNHSNGGGVNANQWEWRSTVKHQRSRSQTREELSSSAARKSSNSHEFGIREVARGEGSAMMSKGGRGPREERGRNASKKPVNREVSPPLKGKKFENLNALPSADTTVIIAPELLEKHYKIARKHVILTIRRGSATVRELTVVLATTWPDWRWAWRPLRLSLNKYLVQFPSAADINEVANGGIYDIGDFTFSVQR